MIGKIRRLYYTSGHNYCNSIIIEGLRIISVYRRVARSTALRLASTSLSHTIAPAIRYWSLSIDVQPWMGFDNRFVLSTVKLRATYCRRCFSLSWIHCIPCTCMNCLLRKWPKLYNKVLIISYLLITQSWIVVQICFACNIINVTNVIKYLILTICGEIKAWDKLTRIE